MDLMESVGKLLAHADEPGSVSEGLKNLFDKMKTDAAKHAKHECGCEKACNGFLVLEGGNERNSSDNE